MAKDITAMTAEMPETEKPAIERIADALEQIAFDLSCDGQVGESLGLIRILLEEITKEDNNGYRFLRTLDIGRD